VVLFIVLYKVILTSKSVDEILDNHIKKSVTSVKVKATEQYFPTALFINMPCKAVLIVESVDKILKCDHSNESSSLLWCRLLCCTRWF